MNMSQTWASPLAVLLLLSGCASIQSPPEDLALKHVSMPDRFTNQKESEDGDQSLRIAAVERGWATRFDDELLISLIKEAWVHNPDLYIAAARFEESAAMLRVAKSSLYPTIDGLISGSHTNVDNDVRTDDFSVGLGVSWEVDLWGRLGSDRAAALRTAESAGLDYVQARYSIAASVAEAYFTVVTGQLQVEIDLALLEAERFTAKTTSQRVGAGLGTTQDSDLAESSVLLAQATLRADQAALGDAKRALELLVGRYPEAEISAATYVLPSLEVSLFDVGVPSELLERRPDVQSAELLVDAAFHDIESARAARLPSLTLSASALGSFDPSELVSSIAADIVAPIFQGGRLEAQEAAANARQRQVIGEFASVALQAFSEVETALANSAYLSERETQLAEASRLLKRASESAVSRYDQGLMTILELQQIRRQDFETRSLLLGVQFERVRQLLNLDLALGGPPILSESESDQNRGGQFDSPQKTSLTGELDVGIRTSDR